MTEGKQNRPLHSSLPQHRSEKLVLKKPEVAKSTQPTSGVHLIIPECVSFYTDSSVTCALASHRQAGDSRQGPCGRKAAMVLHIWPLPGGSSPTAVSFHSAWSLPSPRLSSSKSNPGRGAAGWEGGLRDAASRFNHLIPKVPAKNQLACLAGRPGCH